MAEYVTVHMRNLVYWNGVVQYVTPKCVRYNYKTSLSTKYIGERSNRLKETIQIILKKDGTFTMTEKQKAIFEAELTRIEINNTREVDTRSLDFKHKVVKYGSFTCNDNLSRPEINKAKQKTVKIIIDQKTLTFRWASPEDRTNALSLLDKRIVSLRDFTFERGTAHYKSDGVDYYHKYRAYKRWMSDISQCIDYDLNGIKKVQISIDLLSRQIQLDDNSMNENIEIMQHPKVMIAYDDITFMDGFLSAKINGFYFSKQYKESTPELNSEYHEGLSSSHVDEYSKSLKIILQPQTHTFEFDPGFNAAFNAVVSGIFKKMVALTRRDILFEDGSATHKTKTGIYIQKDSRFKSWMNVAVIELENSTIYANIDILNNTLEISNVDILIHELEDIPNVIIKTNGSRITKSGNQYTYIYKGFTFTCKDHIDVKAEDRIVLNCNIKDYSFTLSVIKEREVIPWDNIEFQRCHVVVGTNMRHIEPLIIEEKDSRPSYNLIKPYLSSKLPKIIAEIQDYRIVKISSELNLSKAIRQIVGSKEYAEVADEDKINDEALPFDLAKTFSQEYIHKKLRVYDSWYINTLQSWQLREYNIIPLRECISHASSSSVTYEDAFIFTIPYFNRSVKNKVIIICENISWESRASLCCCIDRSIWEKFTEAIYNYIRSHADNKRETFRREYIIWNNKKFDIISINHDGHYTWETAIKSLK